MRAATTAHPPAQLGRRGKAQAQFRQGVSLHSQGMVPRALAAFAVAIDLDPQHLGARKAQATVLTSLGHHAEAVQAWEAARALCPDEAEIDAGLGRALSNAGRHEDALSLLTSAAARHPGQAALLVQIGTVLLRLGRPQQAVGALLLAIEAQPDEPQALSALGIAFLHCDDLHHAQFYASQAFQLAPSYDNAVNFSRILLDAGQFDDALSVSSHAIQLQPGSLPARNNHALALEGLGRPDDALLAWEAAVAVAPGDADVHHKLATLLLSLGRMTPGTWAVYEKRLNDRTSIGAIRRWHGEDVAGKTVLLHAEQGLGDTLQFVRYAPLVAARGARVILVVQPSLTRLLASLPGVDRIIPVGGALPPFDVFCPLLSLPAIFQTTLDTIPPPLPYGLACDATPPGDVRVGLVWAGNPGFVNDRRRSIPPGLLKRLTHIEGIDCFSLQFGADALPPGLRIARLMDGVADFADTASRIAGLDLVIAVDTAVAHLAATMGKPVWLLSRYMGCWRWLADRDDSPWYPTMRLYRQSRANDWTGVIQQLEHDLGQFRVQRRQA